MLIFFGSKLKNHGTYISFKIVEGQRNHHLHQDWYHGGKKLFEARMTNAQFVQMITTMNMGSGVPCTIEYRNTEGFKKMDTLPKDRMSEAESVRTKFKEDSREFIEYLRGQIDVAAEIMEKKSIGKKDRKEIMWILQSTLQELECNLPFRVHSFEEATEKVTTEAKLEIEAFVVEAAMRTGLEQMKNLALRGADEDNGIDMIGDGSDSDDDDGAE